MNINKPFTLKELNEILDKIPQPKILHVNQKMYDALKESIDFEPVNVVINNYMPDNQAIWLPDNRENPIRYRVINEPDDFATDEDFWLILGADGRTTKIPKY